MFAIAVIGAFAVYAVVSLLVIGMVASYASKRGKRGWVWGLCAALVMYNLVFWDWIPTVVAHKYYCEKEAGLWIYKSLNQWKVENLGVMEGLVAFNGEHDKHKGDMTNLIATHVWNQRFNLIFKKNGPLLINNWRHEQEIIDIKNNEVIARFVDFSTGNGNIGGELELRFWLHSDGCIGSDSQATIFVKYAKQFRGVVK